MVVDQGLGYLGGLWALLDLGKVAAAELS